MIWKLDGDIEFKTETIGVCNIVTCVSYKICAKFLDKIKLAPPNCMGKKMNKPLTYDAFVHM